MASTYIDSVKQTEEIDKKCIWCPNMFRRLPFPNDINDETWQSITTVFA